MQLILVILVMMRWSNEEDEFKNVEEEVEEKTTTIFTKDIDYTNH